jgi:hypothetical protein
MEPTVNSSRGGVTRHGEGVGKWAVGTVNLHLSS